MFNNIKMLNWAWIHESEDGSWAQFECIPCMILESKWHHWKQNKNTICKMRIGTINFETMTADQWINGKLRILRIKRTENKNRQRPDAEKRH